MKIWSQHQNGMLLLELYINRLDTLWFLLISMLTEVSTGTRLEDMLIDLYLSGYNQVGNAAADATFSLGTDDMDNHKLSTGVSHSFCEFWEQVVNFRLQPKYFNFLRSGSDDSEELEEGEWIPEEDYYGVADSSEKVSNEGFATVFL